jgi:hypothetical protein
MSVKSILDFIGSDAKKFFGWVASPQGQTDIKLGEGVVESLFPAATAVIGVGNIFMNEALKTQALASAAGMAEGNSEQKAAVALQSAGPQAISFFQQYGLPAPTAAQLQEANAGIVKFLNAFSAPGSAPVAPETTVTAVKS